MDVNSASTTKRLANMQFIFTENHDLPAELEDGGTLKLIADNIVEVNALISHFKLFPGETPEALRDRAYAMSKDSLIHHIGTDKRPAYEIDTCLEHDFTAPYEQWAQSLFDFEGPFPNLELPRKWNGLQFTNYCRQLYTQGGHICFKTYVTARPWNNMDGATHAERTAIRAIASDVGEIPHHPEHIQGDHGRMVRNPKYGKYHAPIPAASSGTIKQAFFDWWQANHASPAQLEVIAQNEAFADAKGTYMAAFKFAKNHNSHGRSIYTGHADNDCTSITFEQFKALD